METYAGGLVIVRFLFERGMAAMYLVAFLSALNQFPALLGEKGLLPVPSFIRQTRFRQTPGLFHFHYSDNFFYLICSSGIAVSLFILFGFLSGLSWMIYIPVWLALWFLYMSIVNVGQTFYAFGWESMLLEAGFFTAFIGPEDLKPSIIPFVILRWMLFRVEFGAGLIKLRHDPCWRDFTCLYYHYETQPLPGPLSWYFHHLPQFFHRFGVAFSHFVQVVVPFGIFAPQPFAQFAGLLIIFHQLWLVLCGNYSWLNWITIILGFTAFSDDMLGFIQISSTDIRERPLAFDIVLYALLLFAIILSHKPFMNLFAKNQLMNYNYNAYHLIGAYGAFGSVTKERYEVVIEGTDKGEFAGDEDWKEYDFKGKPGKLNRIPPQVAPYHLRLDWSMWFLPFSVIVKDGQMVYSSTQLWFIRLVEKLLEGDNKVISLLKSNPFEGSAPSYVRARFYLYRFTTPNERKITGNIWERTLVGEYIPPVDLNALYRIERDAIPDY